MPPTSVGVAYEPGEDPSRTFSRTPATPWYEISRESCPPGKSPVGGPSSQTGSRENMKHSFGSVRPHAFQADGPALAREPASLIDGRT